MSNTIHEEITFNTTSERPYQALTDSTQFSEVTGGAPTVIQAEEGGSFSYSDG